MSRTTNRWAIVAFATAGLYWAVLMMGHIAAANPVTQTSPGVPCLSILQDMAARPGEIPQAVQNGVQGFPAALTGTPAPAAAPGPGAADVPAAAA
ncbi:MAG: hypothetical protein JO280_11150, partial [Mycobacteriaceae bacterium]|nr:hypothetical protein [Mycobacteriaceae bacterium]